MPNRPTFHPALILQVHRLLGNSPVGLEARPEALERVATSIGDKQRRYGLMMETETCSKRRVYFESMRLTAGNNIAVETSAFTVD